ncbi:MAG: MerR family transcriptional regulator [Muribaculaceae bacterium]
MNKLYKIGEFSKLCRLTVKALRHYESLGLLMPAHIDSLTGYRYYQLGQSVRVNRILHLKRLGFSLDEIAGLFAEGDNRPCLTTIRQKMSECRRELARLQLQLAQLQSLEQQSLENENLMDEFIIKTIPSRIVASHRRVIPSYDQLGMICYTVIGPEMMRVGCTCPEPQYCYTIEHDAEHKDTDIDLEYCEAVGEMHPDTAILHFYEAPAVPKALCFNHRGDYSQFAESMAKVMQHIEHEGLRIVGNPRFSYIDGPWNRENPADYVTEIQVPVE